MKPIMAELQCKQSERYGTALGDAPDKHHFEFRYGTIGGVLRCHRDKMTLVFVGNHFPGNGEFEPFIAMLERRTAEERVQLDCGAFINSRLLGWFLRRGWHYKPIREMVRYRPGVKAQYPDGLDEMLMMLVDKRLEQTMAYAQRMGIMR